MADSSRIEELKRRVQMDPASIAFAALAEEYRRAGQFEEAIATCEAGLQRHPAYLSARVTLGRALIEMNQYEDAEQHLEHVLRVAPENLAAIRGLAEIHHRRGELPEVLEHYRAGGTAPPAEEPATAPASSPAAAPASPVARIPVPVATTASAAAERPAAVAPEPVPVPVQPPAPAPAPAPVPAPAPLPIPVKAAIVAPTARVPHPDEAALPELEAFLAAIVRAKERLPRRHT